MIAAGFRKHALDVCAGLCVLAAAAHFGHRGLQGESGVFVKIAADKEIERLAADKAAHEAERARLENLTRRLSESYLDLDLLDERAREMLGYIGEAEVVIR